MMTRRTLLRHAAWTVPLALAACKPSSQAFAQSQERQNELDRRLDLRRRNRALDRQDDRNAADQQLQRQELERQLRQEQNRDRQRNNSIQDGTRNLRQRGT
jgi:hypothetical protein